MFTFSYDEATGILHCVSKGFLTIEDARSYGAALARQTEVARRRSGRLRYLLNGGEGMVQAPDVVAEFSKLGSPIRDPNDRMAVIFSSLLAKGQVMRVLNTEQERAFVSISEAMAWLLGDAETPTSS